MFYKGQKKYKASPLFFIVSIGFFLSAFYGTYVPIASAADPTSVSLSASPGNAKLENDTDVTYTATSDQDVGPTIYYITIWEGATKRASCSTGTTCTYTTSGTDVTRTFTAKITKFDDTVFLTGDPGKTTQWLDFTVSLSANPSNAKLENGTDVTYTATANSDVGPSPYYIRIYEGATQRASCSTGTTCTYTTSGTNQTKTFTGKIETSGGTVVGISSDVSTTWVVSDTIAPNNVTSLSSSSHSTSVWKNDSTVDVSWTAATDNAGGSGLDGYSVLWDTTSDTLPDTTKDIEETVTFQTSSSLANGNSHYFHIRSVDNAGNWRSDAVHLGPFFIDTTAPNTPVIKYPAASSVQSGNFWVGVSGDGDTGGSGNTCEYSVKDSGVWTVVAGTRTCRAAEGDSFQVTVGPGANCRTPGGTCSVYIFAQDGAGNIGILAMRAFVIEGILNFPSEIWQRLWYTVSGASPSFSSGNFLGEGPGDNDQFGNPPNVTAVKGVLTDWGGGNVAFGKPNNIGFKSSRTINFPTAGNYRFTIGSDDGARLFIDGTNQVDQWADGSFRTVFKDIEISAGDHQFELDFYENGGNALVYFNYEPSPCLKTLSPPETSFDVTVPTVVGPITTTKSCTVLIDHIGSDVSDSSPVSSEIVSTIPNVADFSATIEMDDQPPESGDCDLDLKWWTEWEAPPPASPWNLWFFSQFVQYSADNNLRWGYQLLVPAPARTCRFIPAESVIGLSNPGETPYINITSSTDVSFSIDALYSNNAANGRVTHMWGTNHILVECLSNAHCTPGSGDANTDVVASKSYCNLGITVNFPQNTCIDSVAPTITIGEIKRTLPDVKVITNNWLKAGVYEISVSVADNVGGSSIDTAYRPVTIRSSGPDGNFDTPGDNRVYTLTRNADNKFSVWVGSPDSPANDCVDQDVGRCRIEVWARDLAGNEIRKDYTLNIDYTAPSAE